MSAANVVELLSEKFEDTALLRFPNLAGVPGFAHAVTTRPWNMAVHCGPDLNFTVERRRRLCEHLRMPFERLVVADQIHSPHVVRVEESDAGAGRDDRGKAVRFVDGFVCDLVNTPVMQFSADCPLIIAIEPRRRVLGTVHASWRGTVARISTELVRQLATGFDVKPADLLVGIAPCAGPDEYEVGEEVRRIALGRLSGAERFFRRSGQAGPSGTKWYFDMRAANVAQLTAAGVRGAAISVASASTMSDPRFYSHRREGEAAGRFGLIAGFRGK